MSTIEQAARRLLQLRRSGTEIGPVHVAGDTDPDTVGKPGATVPLLVARKLEDRSPMADDASASEVAAATGGETGAAEGRAGDPVSDASASLAPVALVPSQARVEIDVARLSSNGYITALAPRSQVAEQFRVVKRPLLTNARGKSATPVLNANRIMVTSSVPAEGKTFVSINLAMSLAMEVDTHVLLVDADTLRPAVLDRLGIVAGKGLLDLLIDPDLPLESVVLSTNVERLSILPAGNPHGRATELLASEAMSQLVERLASADTRLIVLFDTPPLLATSEARVLAAHMGQVIFVVAANDTPQATVAEAMATVENCPVVMTLLNRSTTAQGSNYYGSYGGYGQ